MRRFLALAIACGGVALLSTRRIRPTNSQPNNLAATEEFSQPPRRRLQGLNFMPDNDPRTVGARPQTEIIQTADQIQTDGAPPTDAVSAARPTLPPLQICDRKAPIDHDVDLQILSKYYGQCPLLRQPPEKTTILLLSGVQTFGRTGNNLIEWLHALQYAKDHDALVAITSGSWPIQLITNLWMSIQGGDINQWQENFEGTFCVKILEDATLAEQYRRVIHMDTRDLFLYRHKGLLNQYVEFQGSIIRNLYRYYNDGKGFNVRQKQVRDMCSVLDSLFGNEKPSAVYSVIHSRSLEGEPGLRLLGRIARMVGCDPTAALDMEPEYIKAILEPLGMLEHPILFITDHQRPEILEKLLADPEIGPNIRLIPQEASWIGGDITVATLSDVFIGNPASSFSGFIAKSRVALGYTTTYLFRRKNAKGEWEDVCDGRCIFDKKVMHAMA
ncbi:hypothetical protein ACHAXT_007963 [Thalassiosira profunda]